MDYKIILGFISVIVGVIGLVLYIKNVLQKKTRPHAFSWSVWGLLATIALFAQLTKGGGAGVFATALTAVGCFVVAILAIIQKNKQIIAFDWVILSGAILGVILWLTTKDPLFAVVCVTIADTLGFVPTFRKAYSKPEEETVIQFALSTVKWIFSIPALSAFNLTTLIYPVTLVFTNGIFALMVLVRRKIISKSKL